MKRLINLMRFDAMFLRGAQSSAQNLSPEAAKTLRENEAHAVTLVILRKLLGPDRSLDHDGDVEGFRAFLAENLQSHSDTAIRLWRQPHGPFAELKGYRQKVRAFT